MNEDIFVFTRLECVLSNNEYHAKRLRTSLACWLLTIRVSDQDAKYQEVSVKWIVITEHAFYLCTI